MDLNFLFAVVFTALNIRRLLTGRQDVAAAFEVQLVLIGESGLLGWSQGTGPWAVAVAVMLALANVALLWRLPGLFRTVLRSLGIRNRSAGEGGVW